MSTTVEVESGTETAPVVVTRQSGAIGAIITGINLALGTDDATFELLHQALLDHLVICIRGPSPPAGARCRSIRTSPPSRGTRA
jgi:alpha-ketoglutarate-dependent taurine dioxygenase